MGNTRDQYLQYAKKIVSVLSDEAFYAQYKNKVESGASNIKMFKKRLIQDISIDWIDTIEESLPCLDNIVRNPRKFIVQEEDIVDVSLARSISTESIKHLAQHTNMISKVDKDGTVTPSKILNITKEESYEIYENRFLYTLLLKLKDFVTMRYDKIKKASATQEVLQLDVESRFNLPSKKISYRTEYMAQLSFDEVMQLDPETLTKVERVAKIDRIITDFLSSTFAKAMRSCAPVRPPITRTNVILKEPNFKKALTLWQFVETYQLTGGFATSDEIEDCELADDSVSNLRDMVALNTMLFESLYDHTDQETKMEETEFVDIMRIGELDFLPDKIVRDQWAQKMEDKLKVDEDEKEKEVEKEKSDELEAQGEEKPKEQKPEDKPEDKQKEEKEEEKEEKAPKEKEEGDEENEKDRQTETPPKDWEDEEDDDEPNEEKFDKNLFQVKMLYKRPKDDRLRQEEIGRIKDAIDRCLALYRKQKQDENDEAIQQRKRKHLAERAEALRRQHEEEMLTRGVADVLGDSFSSQAAKIILPKKSDETDELEISELEQKPEERKTHNIVVGNMNLNEQKVDSGYNFDDLKQTAEAKPHAPRVAKEKDNVEEATKRRVIETKDPWALSSTTLNQRYSQATGRTANIEAIDERLVGIGKNPLKLKSANDILGGTFGQDKVKIQIKKKPAKEELAEPVVEELERPIVEKVANKSTTKAKVLPKPTPIDEEDSKIDLNTVKDSNSNQKPTPLPEEENGILSDKKTISLSKTSATKTESKSASSNKSVAKAIIAKGEKASTMNVVSTAKAAHPFDEIDNSSKTTAGRNIRISQEARDPWALSSTTLNQKYSRPSGKNSEIEAIDEKKVAVGKVSLRQKGVNEILGSDVFGGKVEIKTTQKSKSSATNKKPNGTTKQENSPKKDNE
ncbi:MAG: DUF2357 domain-containing protein [Clostridia bacterium]|nr:DUF2357 domain-containing protein [Clostridia bacterium]